MEALFLSNLKRVSVENGQMVCTQLSSSGLQEALQPMMELGSGKAAKE
jgi:hypothetical protein